MKRLTLAFLGMSLTLVAVTAQAETYTVSFHNPASTAVTMSPKITSSNSATYFACSGDCTSLPPNGDVVFKISSNDSSFPWGTFTAMFTYSEYSNTCDSGFQFTKVGYNEVSAAVNSSPVSFFINVGEGLPQELSGNVTKISSCSH